MRNASITFTNIMTIVGLLVAITVGFAPMAWDVFKESRSISLELVSNVELFSNKKEIDGLKVLYHNQEVNKLRKLTYRFSNTGKTEILSSNVRIPLTLELKDTNFLSYKLDKVEPQYLLHDINISYEKESLIIRLKDLKAKEYIEFSIFLDGELKNPLNAYIRIKGINKLNLINYVEQLKKEREKTEDMFTQRHTWAFLLLWILVLLLLLFLIIAIVQEKHRKVINTKVKNSNLKFDSFSLDDLIEFSQNDMKWLAADKKSELLNHINDISDISEQKKILIKLIKLEMNDNSVFMAFWFLLILSLTPFYYLYLHYFS